jgi:hypothetical protein
MESPFALSDEKLKILLDGYFTWSKENENEEKYPELEKQKSEERRKSLLNKEYLSSLSDGELVDVILKYIKTLEGPVGIRLGRPRVSGRISEIKRNILYIIESPDDPFKKAEKILEGEYKIPIFYKAFWSPLFQAQYPELLPNWNNKTDKFLKKLGINLATFKKTTGEKYKLFSEAFLYLKNLDKRHDFYTLDHITHYGTVISEGESLIDKLLFDFDEWVNLDTTKNLINNYIEIRNRKDPELWNEEYKWDILQKVNKEFFKEPMTVDNIVEKISTLEKNNPTSGSFVHWNNLEDLKEIAQQKPEIVLNSLDLLFKGDDILCERVDNIIKEFKKIKKDAKIGTPLFGYLLAMYDYEKYPLYKDSVFQRLKKIIKREKEWKSYTLGMKYQRFQELCLRMGEYLEKSNLLKDIKVNDVEVPVGITALDGQDFFYHLEIKEVQYWRVVEPLDTKEYILWPTCKEKKLIAIGYLDKPNASDVKNIRQEMKIGDKVVAYLEKGRIGGIGTIIGEYEDYIEEKPEDKDFFNGQFWRRRKVQWDYLPTEGEFWQLTDPLPGVHRTVFRLNKTQYDEVLSKIEKIDSGPDPDPIVEITKEELLKEIFLKEEKFDQICSLLENSKKKQLIFQGPPGTGKTFVAQKIALYLTQSEDRIETIQFHPSYSYEDFIEGYRPKDGKFVLEKGIFKLFCERAKEDGDKKYILIIDEINRGNLSKIFGELLYLLEYRDKEAKLTYSQEKFSIPENVYIIGTMNTADRSLAIMDYALRRRFYFVDIKCETKRLEEWLNENKCKLKTSEIIGAIENMNNKIKDEMHSKDFAIGHSYFMREGLDSDKLEEIMNYGVKPLLGEYFFDKDGKVGEITGMMNKFYNKENIEK